MNCGRCGNPYEGASRICWAPGCLAKSIDDHGDAYIRPQGARPSVVSCVTCRQPIPYRGKGGRVYRCLEPKCRAVRWRWYGRTRDEKYRTDPEYRAQCLEWNKAYVERKKAEDPLWEAKRSERYRNSLTPEQREASNARQRARYAKHKETDPRQGKDPHRWRNQAIKTAVRPFKINECKKCGIHFIRTRRADYCMGHVPHAGGRRAGPNPYKWKRKFYMGPKKQKVMNQCEKCGVWFVRTHASARCQLHWNKSGPKQLNA